jgi:hypothetical protein
MNRCSKVSTQVLAFDALMAVVVPDVTPRSEAEWSKTWIIVGVTPDQGRMLRVEGRPGARQAATPGRRRSGPLRQRRSYDGGPAVGRRGGPLPLTDGQVDGHRGLQALFRPAEGAQVAAH